MKLVRFLKENEPFYGILEGQAVVEVIPPAGDWSSAGFKKTGRGYNLEEVKLLAPCTPSKVLCIGLNYRSHADEMGLPLPEQPILFMKPSTAVIGPGDTIVMPRQSRRVDYEAELGVVIGRRAFQVGAKEALDYVFGYTCANDVTARDLQPAAGQWTYAKSFDTFCPLGPVITTEIDDPEKLPLQGLLNGQVVQSGTTADHIFGVAALIEFISGCMTLLPGDVIITGTPSGIGKLKPGDRFTVTIDGIGSLTNPCRENRSQEPGIRSQN